MPLFDFPLEQLRGYLPPRDEPADFDAFWKSTLAETRQHPLDARFERVDYGLRTVESYSVTFNGYGGQRIRGWLMLPCQRSGPLPAVVEYIGYGGGRAFPLDWLLWSSAGYAHLVMDTRGQGSGWHPGDTPDPEPQGSNPHVPGFVTRGVLDPRTYYYGRVFADAVRAVETASSHPAVDSQRVAVAGGSQGGGIALAAAGLASSTRSLNVAAVVADVPFLCHYRRAAQIVNIAPYVEITNYCKSHRDHVATVFNTLSYFDGLNFAARAQAPALFSVGLMDETCPPSTVFAAYNHYAGPKRINVWEYNGHEGGGPFGNVEKVRFMKEVIGKW